MSKEYTSDEIRVLKGLEPVKLRPGMYTRTENPNHIICEVIDNAQDEALAGYAKTIAVEILADGFIAISDDGRGIPVDKMKSEGGRTAAEVIFTELHSGGKFDKEKEGSAYRFSGGLHGVGVSVTNALSDFLEARIKKNGNTYSIKFSNGDLTDPLKLVEKNTQDTGTTIIVKPNPKYFENKLDIESLKNYLKVKSALLPNVRIIFKNLNEDAIEWEYSSLSDYFEKQILAINNNESNLLEKTFKVKKFADSDMQFVKKGEGFECVLGFFEDGKKFNESYVNLIPTINGGRHEQGLRLGLHEALKSFMGHYNLVPPKVTIEADDLWNKCSFVLSMRLLDPQFQGQTKEKLTSEPAQKVTLNYAKDLFEIWLHDNVAFGKTLGELVVDQALKRTRSELKVERKKGSANVTLPGKLSDCSTTNVDEAELFLVEGDSAGGCFSADTKVSLIDGRHLSFLELIKEDKEGKVNYCYTVRDDDKIGIGKILYPRLTKTNEQVIKVFLNNNTEIICTPEHKFLTRNRGYVVAKFLKPSDILYSKLVDISFVKIETLNDRYEVYDIEVENTHNFLLSSGVFVHNSSKMGRDKNFQAILPMRGKLLNTWEVDSHLLFKTMTVEDIAIAVGIPPHKLEDILDWTKLRYGKINVMCDADVDGRHIQVLLLTLFFKHFPQLIKKGHVFIAQAPLFRMDAPLTKSSKKLERKFYVLSDEEKTLVENKLVKEGIPIENIQVSRFKGLGEMNPEQLWETTMNPETRRLVRVTFDENHLDAEKQIFSLLMGSKNASHRREWMEENGNKVEVDI